MEFSVIDWAALGIAILVTAYVSFASNPHDENSNQHASLRICRVGLVLLVWSFGFGLIGFAFALSAFVLGIVGIVKGRSVYGVMLIVGSVVIPVLSVLHTAYSFLLSPAG